MSLWGKISGNDAEKKYHETCDYCDACISKMRHILDKAKKARAYQEGLGDWGYPFEKDLLATEEEYKEFISLHKEVEHCFQVMKEYGKREWHIGWLISIYSPLIKEFNDAKKYIKQN